MLSWFVRLDVTCHGIDERRVVSCRTEWITSNELRCVRVQPTCEGKDSLLYYSAELVC